MKNCTSLSTYILLGLTDDPRMQVLIFMLLFVSYTLTVTGNLTIIILTFVESHLKTAMYFFLKNFSFLETLYTTVCIPRFLYSLTTGDKTISYNACVSQLFFFFLFGTAQFFLLAIMSYDRYVAICKPLHYATIMNSRVCAWLVLCCWIAGCLVTFPPLCLGLNLEFCDYNVIDHFFCDASPMLKISSSDTWFIEQMVVALAVLTDIVTLLCVVMSYTYIIKTIIKFPSAQQKMKAFSTCSSHVIVVSMTYGSCIFIYVKASAKDEVTVNKCVSVLSISVAPMLNPFIYTLRNKQVKQAFIDLIKRISLISKK
ncbi:olfactory receptor 6C2-like [Hippopotamus amphibius kiboko]|uniref:olfactory receptor 6C2-like n=1 Tax=Hippopotamus amphibius kiboko TaxID=575201 RepID=UPI002592ACB5|nr:olfactory receptor 6C2-like [Hippopotamus amphibius kiboko]